MELQEKLTRRPPYVFNLPSDLVHTLSLREDANDSSRNELLATANVKTDECSSADNTAGNSACSICGQKIRRLPPVSETEFEELVRDLNDSISGSDSSVSEGEENGRKEKSISTLMKKQATISIDYSRNDGSSSDDLKPHSQKSPILWLTTSLSPSIYLGIYRTVFSNSEQINDSQILEIINQKQLIPKSQTLTPKNSNSRLPLIEACQEPHYFLCMIGGGHFAAMVVSLVPKENRPASTGPLTKDITVLAHKTFHRYTTRRKQGGAQSANDSAKGAAHSAGASLRRYNEQALTDEVRLLLQDWKEMIESSELLFIRATGSTNRRTLFGPYNNQILRQDDCRIRGFPFSTRRATQNELLRSFIELTRVKVLEIDEQALATVNASSLKATSESTTKAAKNVSKLPPELTEEEKIALLHTSQLQALIRRNRLPALLTYLKDNSISPDFRFHPFHNPQNHHAPTPLFLAASLNSAPLVTGLLLKAGSDPNVRNNDGKTAFELSGERATRQAFCVARFELGENKWDWDQAGIPKGISRIEAEARNKREKEEEQRMEEQRRKTETDRIKLLDEKDGSTQSKGNVSVLGRLSKTAQEKREEEARGLTPEMRMRLERERRARAAEERVKKLTQRSS
ncbi:hypothetical protein K3495_g2904 [Podosphaera aphanis]|nr:hypothetical protein K3495_g2904 [Podosphaera aphanis]